MDGLHNPQGRASQIGHINQGGGVLEIRGL
jgi:hypothetical protein